jgi:hypothetical protein
MKIM